MEIRLDDLTSPKVHKLLAEHVESMFEHSPAESVHVLDLEKLRAPEITFWSAWDGDELLGCGAIKELDPLHGEIKSMRTAAEHLRKGVAAAILTRILNEAKGRGYERVSLETGSTEVFKPAQKLYEKFGFEYCGPFGDYVLDSFSVFMTKELVR
ncbi:MAG: GNAT family N-acetyltransferase [Acidobacteria bacterium]|nr:GNAT family N-acetyltransferase [Acidobacteriota bacterium]